MTKSGDVLIAFWDMKSRGTLHMINLAKKYKLKIYVIDYNNRKIIENYNNYYINIINQGANVLFKFKEKNE